ncbi:MAG: DUF2189 domain-containing protein [Proteobacteria bacterium]|nr:DUF2189 domain-containing protein [Pseudomonadota bacterium]MBU6424868.1 DUF2189 domain-containing protein [Rhodospirillales bacterium]
MTASLFGSRVFSSLDDVHGYPGADQYPQTTRPEATTGPIRIERPGLSVIFDALREGVADWRTFRTDVVVNVVIYPLAAALLAGVILDRALLPFVFPVCAGMALIGPVGTIWFAALSRQRERDGTATSDAAAAIFDSPRRLTVQRLALLLIGLFALWIVVAGIVYSITLGRVSGGSFFDNLFTTIAGYEMLVIGVLLGAAFALVALAIGLVGFQLALDREMGVGEVVSISLHVALANPRLALAWGGVVVAGLVLGALPGLLGLSLAVPILGHASWHLYRRLVAGE